jgi:hypothetical protein
MVTGNEPVVHGRDPMFTSDPVVIEHSGFGGVFGCDRQIVATALNKAVLKPRYDAALKERFSLQRKGLLQLTMYLA